jgi:hypothetical protein
LIRAVYKDYIVKKYIFRRSVLNESKSRQLEHVKSGGEIVVTDSDQQSI